MKNRTALSFTLITMLFVTFTACEKLEPPKGTVIVIDEQNMPVWDADVFLHAYDVPPPGRPGDSIVVRQGSTDVNGRFSFEMENPCVLTIEAIAVQTFTDSATGTVFKDTIFGTASIRMEMDEVTEQKVIVRP